MLRLAGSRGIAVVPFGGGTSVVGGLDPERGAHRAVIALELRRLTGLVSLDETSGEAVLQAGTTGPEAERLLGAHGFELGHFPQSFRYATIGGFAAARSSGQNSAGNGRFDAMVTGLRVATPTGELDLGRAPGIGRRARPAAPLPRLRGRVRRHHRGAGARASRARDAAGRGLDASPTSPRAPTRCARVAQLGTGPTVIRLSDEAETGVSLAQVGRIGKALAKGASAVTIFEGDAELAAERQARTAQVLREAGGVSAGPAAAEEWVHGRFNAPYLRDALLDHGVFCETLETATTWSNLDTTEARRHRRDHRRLAAQRASRSCSATSRTSTRRRRALLHDPRGVKGDEVAAWSR